MAVLTPEARRQWGDARRSALSGLGWLLFAAGWLTAKTLRVAALGIAAPLFGVGWLGAKAIWPGLKWCGRAVRLGWDEGRGPIGGRRGPA